MNELLVEQAASSPEFLAATAVHRKVRLDMEKNKSLILSQFADALLEGRIRRFPIYREDKYRTAGKTAYHLIKQNFNELPVRGLSARQIADIDILGLNIAAVLFVRDVGPLTGVFVQDFETITAHYKRDIRACRQLG